VEGPAFGCHGLGLALTSLGIVSHPSQLRQHAWAQEAEPCPPARGVHPSGSQPGGACHITAGGVCSRFPAGSWPARAARMCAGPPPSRPGCRRKVSSRTDTVLHSIVRHAEEIQPCRNPNN